LNSGKGNKKKKSGSEISKTNPDLRYKRKKRRAPKKKGIQMAGGGSNTHRQITLQTPFKGDILKKEAWEKKKKGGRGGMLSPTQKKK